MKHKFFNFPSELVEEITMWYGGIISPIIGENRWIGNANDAREEYRKRLVQNGFEEVHYTTGRLHHTQISVDGLYKKYDEKVGETYLYYYTVNTYKRGNYSSPDMKHYVFRLHKFPEIMIYALACMDRVQIPYYHFIQGTKSIEITTKQ